MGTRAARRSSPTCGARKISSTTCSRGNQASTCTRKRRPPGAPPASDARSKASPMQSSRHLAYSDHKASTTNQPKKMTELATRTFPSRIADLGFALALPSDWISHELPPETPNFDDPTQLIALAVVTAPHSAIVLAVAARPAYSEGTLSDWGRWLLERESAGVRA